MSETRSELDQAAELAAHKRLRRARAPWTSMVLSLLVVVGIAFVLVLIVPRVNQVTQPPVDVPLGARAAASQVEFTPSVPVGLPDGWRATSVRTTRSTAQVVTWHAGYQTPQQQYAALEQGKDAPDEWLSQQTNRAPKVGTQQIDGETWQRYAGGRANQNSLVHTRDAVTTIVTGTAPFDDLTLLAESLRPPG
ncbi:DUF4245 domain-containing protein [Angustibacter luteus]|uniref:DUF4245 domain-containing protein n=1 Tax=Angustibacter luteus TaxID=658456 RepID=UPI00366D0970